MRDHDKMILVEDDDTLGASLQDVIDFCNSHLGSLHLLVRDAYTEAGVQVTGRRPNTWISAAPPPLLDTERDSCDDAVACETSSTTNNDDNDEDTAIMSVPCSEFLCPITQELLVDPVVAQDGFTYERCAILEWFAKCIVVGQVTSPLTNAPLASAQLFDNNLVRSMVLAWHAKRRDAL